MYKDNAETVAGCCSTMLFLGGKEESSLKMVSGLLGKETIDTMNESDSRGAQRTYGLNYQKLGKELMSVDELAVMPSSRCIVQVQGVRPFYSKKYDLTKHPQYKYTADAKAADHLSAACSTQAAVVQSVEKKQKSTQPPKLYDLTSLQRDGNRLFGYTAQQVLDYAQALYEKKLLTYPRTDSNYLTEDMKDTIPALCELAASALPFSVAALSVDAPRVINNGKVSDHHALLPTKQISGADFSSLPAGERNILTLVTVEKPDGECSMSEGTKHGNFQSVCVVVTKSYE